MNKLIYRDSRHEDECILGYLMRISEMNGFKHLGYLMSYAGLSWKNNRVPVHRILTGEFELEGYFHNLKLQYTSPTSCSLYDLFQKKIDTPYIFVRSPKVCPLCLKEHGYAKAEWSYLPILSCTSHKVMLVDTQISTGKRLSWYRQKLTKFDINDADDIQPQISAPKKALQFSGYFEAMLNNKFSARTPSILIGLKLSESLSMINYLVRYQLRLLNHPFLPLTFDNYTLSSYYLNIWEMLSNWPDSFYAMLSQYIESPMSRKGNEGINKHFRDIHESLYRLKENKGVLRVKVEFDRYIEEYWPGVLDQGRISRVNIKNTRNIISKKEAARIIGCRPERIDKFVQLKKLTLTIFKGKAHYNRDEVTSLASLISSNWSMSAACDSLQITRYQLKQLLDSEIITTIQRPNLFNRDWIINKTQCQALITNLLQKATNIQGLDPSLSMAGIQRRGFSIVQLISAMQKGNVEFATKIDKEYPYSLMQFISFRIK